ncbi:hypothetical protein D9M70_547100 [compost metagenome]
MNASLLMPEWVAAMIFISPSMPLSARAFWSPSSTALNGCCSFHSGCCGARRFTSSRANSTSKYSGCSLHRVPSLSNTAMRSATGTKSLPPSVVTAVTKASMALRAGPSFHDGKGSWAWARSGSTRSSANHQRNRVG